VRCGGVRTLHVLVCGEILVNYRKPGRPVYAMSAVLPTAFAYFRSRKFSWVGSYHNRHGDITGMLCVTPSALSGLLATLVHRKSAVTRRLGSLKK
jgi:hypothetical protein